MPKLVSVEMMTQSVYIPHSTNLVSSSRSTLAAMRRIKTKQQCSVVSDGNKQTIRQWLSYETHQQATNAIQSRDFERDRVLCSTQKVERGKSTHPSFAEFGHNCNIGYKYERNLLTFQLSSYAAYCINTLITGLSINFLRCTLYKHASN